MALLASDLGLVHISRLGGGRDGQLSQGFTAPLVLQRQPDGVVHDKILHK